MKQKEMDLSVLRLERVGRYCSGSRRYLAPGAHSCLVAAVIYHPLTPPEGGGRDRVVALLCSGRARRRDAAGWGTGWMSRAVGSYRVRF